MCGLGNTFAFINKLEADHHIHTGGRHTKALYPDVRRSKSDWLAARPQRLSRSADLWVTLTLDNDIGVFS